MSAISFQARGPSSHRKRPARMWLYSGAGLAFLSLMSGATPQSMNPQAAPPPPPPPQLAQATLVSAPAAPMVYPLDEPLRIIAEAREAYSAVRDYTCTLIKKEKMGGQAPIENVMNMKVRTRPFSVSLQWLEPKDLVGQEAVYVAGRNNGQMRVRSSGFLGNLGFVSLEPDDARAKQTSKHAITEAGVGNLLHRYSTGWQTERTWNLTQVNVAEYEYNKRRCVRVETTHPSNPENRFLFFRNVIYFDSETKLPVRTECYDWPRRVGDKPELIEVYSYVNMKLNVGLRDDVFNK